MKITSVIQKGVQLTHPKKLNKHIEIVGSSNPRLNAMSRDSQLSMLSVLSARYTNVSITIVDDMSDLMALVAKKPDLVVLGMKLVLLEPSKSYDDSAKMWLSSYLDQHNITFTGSNTAALTLEYSKHDAKQKVIDAGLQSSAYAASAIGDTNFEHSLKFPLFVKPNNSGDSKGIDENSVVETEQDLRIKVASIHNEHKSDALIEEYLPGREFSVAVIQRPLSDSLLAMPVEIIAPADDRGHTFLSEAVKSADVEKVTAVTDVKLKEEINKLAIGVFRALGSRDYGRIDVRLDGQGIPSFIEANLMPGLSDHGYLARCFKMNEHISYVEMILSIVELAFARQPILLESIEQTILLNGTEDVLVTEAVATLPVA